MNSASAVASVVRHRLAAGIVVGLAAVLLAVAVPESRGPVVAIALLSLRGWLRTPPPGGGRRRGPAAAAARVTLSAAAVVAIVVLALAAFLLYFAVLTSGAFG